jgi:hypothetical protein
LQRGLQISSDARVEVDFCGRCSVRAALVLMMMMCVVTHGIFVMGAALLFETLWRQGLQLLLLARIAESMQLLGAKDNGDTSGSSEEADSGRTRFRGDPYFAEISGFAALRALTG